MTRFLLGIAVAILVFAAIQAGCGPADENESPERTPVVSLDCDELVCTLLVHYASEVRVYDTVDLDAYHLWEDNQGYLDERRLTYRFPLPDTGVVVAEACNSEVCTTAVEPTQD